MQVLRTKEETTETERAYLSESLIVQELAKLGSQICPHWLLASDECQTSSKLLRHEMASFLELFLIRFSCIVLGY